MGQKENMEQLLRLLSSTTGCQQTVETVTKDWEIDPNLSMFHNSIGKVISNDSISINDYYPLVDYPLGVKQQLDERAKREA